MTCVTCHNPHEKVSQAEAAVYYRDRCLQCHDDSAASHDCGLSLSVRVESNDNDCAACHMPRGDSEIPHAPTTDHRIAVHRPDESPDRDESTVWQTRVGKLVIEQISPSPQKLTG